MRVVITVARRTEYTSVVEMSQADFDRLNNALDASSAEAAKAAKELNALIDTRDWQDDALIAVTDFTVERPTP